MKKILFAIICIFIMSNYVNAWSEYKLGDEVEYNGINFYVIENSSTNNDVVKLLKDTPLKSSEMLEYLESTEIYGKRVSTGISSYNVLDLRGEYIKVSYYASDNCTTSYYGAVCNVDYVASDVKQVIDVWANNYLDMNDLKKDNVGYKARMITYDELTNDLGIQIDVVNPTDIRTIKNNEKSGFIFNDNYQYWTMGQRQDYDSQLWMVDYHNICSSATYNLNMVRPVIILKKSALGDIDISDEDDDINNSDNSINNTINNRVYKIKVPNTLEKISIIVIMIGIVLISISIVIVVKNKDVIRKKLKD